MLDLPYFDLLMDERQDGGEIGRLWEHQVHYGYWEDPKAAEGTRADYVAAMEQMNGVLLEAGKVADGQRLLDVGCGFGGTIQQINAGHCDMHLTGLNIDPRQLAAAEAQTKAANGNHIAWVEADACQLPFEDNSFDRAFSMLVLQFIPDAARAVAEMRRVVRSGGTVTAAVWDAYGGMPHMRMVWDIAAVLDPSIEGDFFRPLSQPNEMANLWHELGFVEVEQTSLLIRMEFSGFDDYWLPLTSEGPLAKFAAGLSATARASLTEQVRRAYVANLSDGPRSFASVAWACRGTVPA